MKQFCFTCIFLCVCCSSNGQSWLRADSLFSVGEYERAALGFERLAFESDTNHEKAVFLLKKAYCYKVFGNYERALENLKRIKVSSSDTLKNVLTYEKILLTYLLKDYQGSYNEILKHKLVSEQVDDDILYLEALNLVAMNKWTDAKELIKKNLEILGISNEEVDYVFSKSLKPKDPQKAFNLSMFLPGTGQMYAGYFFKGLVSGGIQAVLVGASAYSLYQGYFFTGGMTGVALFYTFYFGGAKHARELAVDRNRETSAEIGRRIGEVNKKSPR